MIGILTKRVVQIAWKCLANMWERSFTCCSIRVRLRETEKHVFALTQIQLSMRDLDRKREGGGEGGWGGGAGGKDEHPAAIARPPPASGLRRSSLSFAPPPPSLPTFNSSSFFVFLLERPGYRLLQIDDGESIGPCALGNFILTFRVYTSSRLTKTKSKHVVAFSIILTFYDSNCF